MKVYFEHTGGSLKTASLQVYVDPTGDGHAYHFGADEQKYLFAWANPKKARVFESDELPKQLWYSIHHGVDNVEVPIDKVANYEWSDVSYRKVSKTRIEAYKKVLSKIDDVQTIEDFKALYPLIKKCGIADNRIMDKLFQFCNTPDVPVYNGEIGIAFFQKQMVYKRLLHKIGLE